MICNNNSQFIEYHLRLFKHMNSGTNLRTNHNKSFIIQILEANKNSILEDEVSKIFLIDCTKLIFKLLIHFRFYFKLLYLIFIDLIYLIKFEVNLLE